MSVEGDVGDVCLILTPHSDGIDLTLLYTAERIDASTAGRWAHAYRELLREYAEQHTAGARTPPA